MRWDKKNFIWLKFDFQRAGFGTVAQKMKICYNYICRFFYEHAALKKALRIY